MSKEETIFQLNKLLNELKNKQLIYLLDEEGNETNLSLDGFAIKDDENPDEIVGWCHLN